MRNDEDIEEKECFQCPKQDECRVEGLNRKMTEARNRGRRPTGTATRLEAGSCTVKQQVGYPPGRQLIVNSTDNKAEDSA